MISKVRLIASISFVLLSFALFAQPGGGGDPGHGQPVPIPGIEILIAVGAIFGIRKMMRARTK